MIVFKFELEKSKIWNSEFKIRKMGQMEGFLGSSPGIWKSNHFENKIKLIKSGWTLWVWMFGELGKSHSKKPIWKYERTASNLWASYLSKGLNSESLQSKRVSSNGKKKTKKVFSVFSQLIFSPKTSFIITSQGVKRETMEECREEMERGKIRMKFEKRMDKTKRFLKAGR